MVCASGIACICAFSAEISCRRGSVEAPCHAMGVPLKQFSNWEIILVNSFIIFHTNKLWLSMDKILDNKVLRHSPIEHIRQDFLAGRVRFIMSSSLRD